MAEYIKREDVIERLTGLFQLQASTAKAIIESIPAADVVELSMKLHGDEAAIAGMKREIERMVVSGNKSRWIPVKERLPEIGTYIIAGHMKYDYEKAYTHFVDVAYFGPRWNDTDYSWQTFNDWFEGQQEFEITHWMPLPEPPKEE